MRRIVLLVLVLSLCLTGCVVAVEKSDNDKDLNKFDIKYIEGKNVVIDEQTYIALFYEYTNRADETAIPAEQVDVKAFQNGEELVITVFTGDKIEGAVQCDTSIQKGTTARIVWLFERVDDSPVSIEMSNGNKFVVE